METSFDKVFPPCSGNFGRCRHAKRLTRQKLGGGYDRYNPERCSVGFYEVDTMFRSRMAEAALIGCLAALASFCALSARAGETYSIVAQSSRSSATTGRRPLAERISAANLPIITARPAPEPAAAIARADNAGSGSVSPTDDADAATAAPVTRSPRLPRWAVPLSGVGVAAGVAAAAILWLRFDAPGAASVAAVIPAPVRVVSAERVLPAPVPLSAESGASAPDSYTVPPASDAPAVLMGGAMMANFVVAHSEVAAPLLRRNALSSLVADAEARYEEIAAPSPGQFPLSPSEAGTAR